MAVILAAKHLSPLGTGGSAGGEDDGEGSRSIEPALRNDRRRAVLTYLSAQDGEADLCSLALHLAAGGDETLSTVIEELHHHHLPTLAQRDLLQYEDAGAVALSVEPEHAEALVSRIGEGGG